MNRINRLKKITVIGLGILLMGSALVPAMIGSEGFTVARADSVATSTASTTTSSSASTSASGSADASSTASAGGIDTTASTTANASSSTSASGGSASASASADATAGSGTNESTCKVTTGSITICKVIENASGTIVNGAAFPGQVFTVPGIATVPSTTAGAAGLLPTSVFTTPVPWNEELFGSRADNAKCLTYDHLALGDYYYGQEQIATSTYQWATPRYNDQNTVTAATPANTFPYSGELFDNDPSNDSQRNQNADGDITLTRARPNRELIVLNQFLGSGTTTPQSAGLTIVKTADVTSTVPGGTVHYMLTVDALGPVTSTGVVATDTLPSELTFENATASVGSYASSTGTWTIGDLSPSSTATLAIQATVNPSTPTGTTIVNTAIVGENASTTNPNPNTSSTIPVIVTSTSTCTSNCGGGGGGGGGGVSSSTCTIVSDTNNLVYGSGPVAINNPYVASWLDTTGLANGGNAALVATPYNTRWTASIPGGTLHIHMAP